MEAVKMRVHGPEHSEIVQRMLFAAGCGWAPVREKQLVRYEDALYLYVYRDGQITHGSCTSDFNDHDHQEVSFDWCVPKRETIEIGGVEYYADEVEARLRELDPVE